MKNHITTIHIDNLVSESKQFLNKIRSAERDNLNPSGIRIQVSNEAGEKHNTLIYEQQVYVVVVPHGQKDKALLYGNWDEAIHASKQLLITELSLQKNHSITLSSYSRVL